jgi:hypothetical protein
MKKIIEQIKETIKPKMEIWKADRFTFLKNLEAYCKSTVYKEGVGCDAYGIHALKTKHGYSKSMERYFSRSEADLKLMIEKDAAEKMFNIERAAYKKLKGVVVETVENLGFTDTAGSWLINGNKVFRYEVIPAGGYNVQCFHIRTLFYFK